MYIILGLILVTIVYLVTFYNGLKTAQVQIGASIQEIGNQLKRQIDLIPNLVDSAKGYMKHEKDIFKELTDARKLVESAKTGDPKSVDKAQASINNVLKSLNVIVESNPEIKASSLVSDLMGELRDTADKIMYARRTLIDLSADFNVKISTVPGMWIAPTMGFRPEAGFSTPTSGEFLSASNADTKNPKVSLN
ncbi:LemA family protein [Candidatus Shapirobacteria bacterium]|nr:LemA family protein [Candidatus Shapirobacteria bacterium]